MALYVTNYGLSYEKFFASYTVLYCAILFGWLTKQLFMKKRADILRFVCFLFLWMFSVVAVFPVERFILSANVSLASRLDSRIRLFELTMLSPDVLGLVKKYEREGRLKEKRHYLGREGEKKKEEDFNWKPWIEKQEKIIVNKKWYEKNILNYFN